MPLFDYPESTRMPELTGKKVWHAFQLHALLKDSVRQDTPLKLLHKVNEEHAIHHAIQQRNARLHKFGDSVARNHACDLCCKKLNDGMRQLLS